MSFEGYYQILCDQGHAAGEYPVQYDCGAEQEYFREFRCPARVQGMRCGAKIGWTNMVDDTNVDAYGYHQLIEQTPRETKVCDLGETHVWTEATYKPSANPYYWDQETWVELVPKASDTTQ